jgi:hypothetical protein
MKLLNVLELIPALSLLLAQQTEAFVLRERCSAEHRERTHLIVPSASAPGRRCGRGAADSDDRTVQPLQTIAWKSSEPQTNGATKWCRLQESAGFRLGGTAETYRMHRLARRANRQSPLASRFLETWSLEARRPVSADRVCAIAPGVRAAARPPWASRTGGAAAALRRKQPGCEPSPESLVT